MAQTRDSFDQCAYALKKQQSEASGFYRLFNDSNNNCKKCFSNNGPRNNRLGLSSEFDTVSEPNRVEVESLLSNRGYPLTRCMNERTLFEKNTKLNGLVRTKGVNDCEQFLDMDNSRLDNPASNLRGIWIDRWEWPMINPYEFVFWDRIGKNSPRDTRDNFRRNHYANVNLN